jgi:predicted Rossmann fold nucleotide-binding protein DprA/Smf involved in DNA uptake
MKVTSIKTTTLKALLSLTKKKDKLIHQIENIEKQMEEIAAHAEPGKTSDEILATGSKSLKGIRRGGRKRRSPHGFMTSEIKRMLASAGDQGVSVQSVVTSLDKPSSNVSVWFSNAKKAGLVESIRRGVYRLKNAPVVVATTTIS